MSQTLSLLLRAPILCSELDVKVACLLRLLQFVCGEWKRPNISERKMPSCRAAETGCGAKNQQQDETHIHKAVCSFFLNAFLCVGFVRPNKSRRNK